MRQVGLDSLVLQTPGNLVNQIVVYKTECHFWSAEGISPIGPQSASSGGTEPDGARSGFGEQRLMTTKGR
jgi:hypothetical protein